MQQSPIKAMISDKYNSESQAARELGWSRQRLNRITTGRKEPSLEEANALAKLLSMPVGDIVAIFLTH